jgi:hypothetical protein
LGRGTSKIFLRKIIQITIADIVRMFGFFQIFVNEEDYKHLMEEVSEEELKEVLCSFQKNKSLGPNGWTIEFFLGFYDLIWKDILQVVEESCSKVSKI